MVYIISIKTILHFIILKCFIEVKRRHVESLSYELTLHSEPSIHFNATASITIQTFKIISLFYF